MTVRAKFKVQRIERTLSSTQIGTDSNGRAIYGPCELQTIVLNPVFPNGDPNHENTRFWQASPSGEIKLGTINAEAAAQFDIGQEFYIDFIPAPVDTNS